MAPAEDEQSLMNSPAAAGAAPMDEGEPVQDDTSPIVLCTILDNRDGTYQLVIGDEGDAGAEDGMSGEDAEGMPPAAGGVAPQPAGKTFDSPGPLLKEVLDILKAAEERSGGSAEKSFDEGFSGPKEPVQKY